MQFGTLSRHDRYRSPNEHGFAESRKPDEIGKQVSAAIEQVRR
jgi:hypothetical protein